ncbi:DegT/DnrJ/EryC1/StrS aminotransferase family-domain-containing protein [Hyaloraphidium curvatum]|nr:DegT/DnrJ/EryC1/StrS aminotransferase family-domain-containing protein [Hyaloraphidium curvatum]
MYGAFLANSLNRSIADEVLVAAAPCGKLCGLISFGVDGTEGKVVLLAVDPDRRRAGIGKALLARALLWARDHGAATIRVVSQGRSFRLPSQALYERAGLRIASRTPVHHAWLPQHILEPAAVRADVGPIPFLRPYAAGGELALAARAIGSPDSAEFQSRCVAFLSSMLGPGCEAVHLTPSCTAALELAALCADLAPGDEVIVPAFTFPTTASPFALRGAVPVFVDVQPATLNIDPALAEAAVTPRTRAIVAVHYAGVPCDMDALASIAARNDLLLIEDAAQALFSTYKGRPAGSLGDAAAFSFHRTKNVSCGEGGALALRRAGMAAGAAEAWDKGTDRREFLAGRAETYQWTRLGSSYAVPETSAAVLLAQLERGEAVCEERRGVCGRYAEGLADLVAVGRFAACEVPEWCEPNGHIFWIMLPSAEERARYERVLAEAGVSTARHYQPLHLSPAGQRYGRAHGALPVAERAAEALLRLPVWPGMSRAEVAHVIAAVRRAAGA